MALLLAGCAGREARLAGDRAWAAGDAVAAARHYEMAVSQQPKLAQNERFAERLREARREGSYREGVALIQRRDWDAAIDRLTDALVFEPGNRPAEEALQQAHAGAADAAVARALAAADAGDEDRARAALRDALDHRSDHAEALEAGRSLSATPAASLGDSQATQLLHERRWPEAIADLDRVIEAQSTNARARLLRAEARTKHDRTTKLLKQGGAEFHERQLETALRTLTEAADLSPHHAEVAAALGEAREAWARLTRLQDEADAALRASNWDQAIASAQAAQDIYPASARAIELESAARDAAARHHHAAAEAARGAEKLDEAEAAYRRALNYQPQFTPAREGLARVALIRSDDAAKAERWGEAFLWALDADELDPHSEAAERARTAEGAILDRAAATVTLDNDGSPSGDALRFEDEFTAALRRHASETVRIVSGRVNGLEPRYVVTVDAADVDVDEERTGFRQLYHPFEIRRNVHNPRRPHLVWELRRIEDELERLDHERFRRAREYLQAKAESDRDPTNQALRDRAQHLAAYHEQAEERKEHVLDRRDGLRGRLASEPEMIVEAIPARWDYVVETYRKTAELTGRVEVRDRVAERELQSVTVRETATDEDSVIDRPNPEIGLAGDPLDLPTDASLADAVLRTGADRAAREVVATVLRAAEDAARAAAAKAEAAGDRASALERRVDAAVLTEDRSEIKRLREALRQRE